MRLSAEAARGRGYCKALMGNHELLLIGAKRFSDTPVNSGAGTATFQAAWLLNGGQKSDMDRLQDVHLQWMSRLDAVVEEDGHLLMHSDTTAYLDDRRRWPGTSPWCFPPPGPPCEGRQNSAKQAGK
ncbi:hypothetical protein SMICM304S_07703 [Streptomyces microflavus]